MHNRKMTRKNYEKLQFRHQIAYMEQQMASEITSPENPLPVFWVKSASNLELEILILERMNAFNTADFTFLEKAEAWAEKHDIDTKIEVKCRCCDNSLTLNNFHAIKMN